jgi:hypothetical protein
LSVRIGREQVVGFSRSDDLSLWVKRRIKQPEGQLCSSARAELTFGWRDVMEPTSTAPVEVAVEALATATASPMTATDGDILTLVADLARIACYLGELTAAARDRWADWGTVTPHLQQAEALAADTTRCLSHAAGIYAFNTNRPDTTIGRLASTGTARSAA